jgi:hypothetical protein
MSEQTTGKLIQHWPLLYNRDEPQACVGSDYTEDDLWSDLARNTLGDGDVLVIGLYPDDERHHIRFQQSLIGNRFGRSFPTSRTGFGVQTCMRA